MPRTSKQSRQSGRGSSQRGFARMSASQRREIAARGGHASHGGRNRQSGNGYGQSRGGTSRRGFGSMDPERRREIAAEGGRASRGGWGRDYEGGGSRGRSRSEDYGYEDRSSRRGFASMDPERRREIASEGGRASHGGWGRDNEGGGSRGRSRYDEDENERGGGEEDYEGGGRSRRGFAGMDPERRREIAAEGGRASHGGHSGYGRDEDDRYSSRGSHEDYDEQDWRGQGQEDEDDDSYGQESDYDEEDDSDDEYEYRGRGRSSEEDYDDRDQGGPRRGFASWDAEDRRRVAAKGGHSSHRYR